MKPRSLVLFALFAVLGCASGGGSSSTQTGSSTPRQQRTTRDVIAQAEIERTEVSNALDLIQRLRPEFLRPRGAGGVQSVPVAIYVDGIKQSSASVLSSVPKNLVVEIRFINATDATTRFGSDHGNGAVLVTTRH